MIGLLRKLFLAMIGGSRNDRIIRGKRRFVTDRVNPLAEKYQTMSDEDLLAASEALRARVAEGASRDEVKPDAFALVREASRRARDHRQFDVQLIAGTVLDDGWVAEEATGEGKTIACYPAIYMAWLEGLKTHVVTVNDYLVQRDAEFARPIFALLGVTVGYITAEMDSSGPEAEPRRQAYACDVTYGTNSEFGFDYLRDNMKTSTVDQMQGPLDFAIVDEIDSVLIDEARTPLIISGPAYGQTERFRKADKVARQLIQRNRDWERADRDVRRLQTRVAALTEELKRGGKRGGAEPAKPKEAEAAKPSAGADAGGEKYLASLRKRKAELEDQLARTRKRTEQVQVPKIEKDLRAAQDKWETARKDLDTAAHEAEAAERDAGTAGEQKDEAVAKLRQALDALERAKKKFVEAEREVGKQQERLDNTTRDVQRLDEQLREVESKLDMAESDKDSVRSAARDRAGGSEDELRRQLEEAEEQLDRAEQVLAEQPKLYEIELDKKSAHMTDEGVAIAQEIAGVGSFYVGANIEWPHLMDNALKAHLVYQRDKDYVVQDRPVKQVIIVDEFTGRLMHGRQWSDGLHQAVDAKEGAPIKEENQTLATITLQNYFKLYKKLAGMTGTAVDNASEFLKTYKLDVASIPTNRPLNRIDYNDVIYGERAPKIRAIVEETRKYAHDLGRPVLIGTTSVEMSERISGALKKNYGIEHSVLNAKREHAEREALTVAEAGQQRPIKPGAKKMVGTVTIVTNMAARGTDIKLGDGVVNSTCCVPPPDELARLGVEPDSMYPSGANKCCIRCDQYDPSTHCGHCFKPKLDAEFPVRGRTDCREDVPCGLHIVGTERHEARRIDNQLRGRAGRQGDPGSSRFFLSLQDELLATFAGEWTLKMLGWLGLKGDVAIEDRRVSKGVERAQKKVEERNFEVRKNLLEYDEVMDHQRHTFYDLRQKILEGQGLREMVWDMVESSVSDAVQDYLDGQYPRRCIAEWASKALQMPVRAERINISEVEELPELVAGLKQRAKDEAAGVIDVTLGEYMDEEIDESEWDLRGLIVWAKSRFNVELTLAGLRGKTPKEVSGELLEAAGEQIDQVNFEPLEPYLQEDFARSSLAEWARVRFLIDLDPDQLRGDPSDVRTSLMEKVRAQYRRREIEYPVELAMERTVGQAGSGNVYIMDTLAHWANAKYGQEFTSEDFRDREPDQIARQLIQVAEACYSGGKLEEQIRQALGSNPTAEAAEKYAAERFDTKLPAESLNGDAMGRLIEVGRDFLRREMTALEQFVLLRTYDSSWKDHLLGMDHLKSGVGLRGYAEQDPRVAYKREGAALFQDMLAGVRDKVTSNIFRIRSASGREAGSVYQISNAVHEQLQGFDHLARTMAGEAQAAQTKKVETIVRETPRVGRNEKCPCGSGKKYKNCCGRDKA